LKTNAAFDLVSFAPEKQKHADTLVIYIEGDGFAWRNRRTPSRNPTPKTPVALELAMKHNVENEAAVYLARPCQYIELKTQPACETKYWTSHRFAPEVIQSTDAAINQLKEKHNAAQIKLVGYSGGGAVAALVAAKRDDVIELVTIAGNLDIEAWAGHHDISPLSGSLNPADFWQNLADIPQTHYVGEDDKIVPPSIAQSYSSAFPNNKKPKIIAVKDANHQCCWVNGAEK
jgi:pimeloyl-ACP methyl ester carboxylesterase